MIPFKDKTFCASPKCKNECGRKMTKEQEIDLKMLRDSGYDFCVSQGYFCGEPEKDELNG